MSGTRGSWNRWHRASWVAVLAAAAFAASPLWAGASTFEVLHLLDENSTYIKGSLVIGVDGNYYGTSGTSGGGHLGMVFRLQPDGQFTVLHMFRGGAEDGDDPQGLVLASDGNLYGVTAAGGTADLGTAFRVDINGEVTLLRSFTGSVAKPRCSLLAASDGYLYGVTTAGNGAVYRMTTAGQVEPVHMFKGGRNDGSFPDGRLIEGRDGLLYGTTYVGGRHGSGTVFKMKRSDGDIRLLHHFAKDGRDGNRPISGVSEGPDGWFYGTIIERRGKAYRRGLIYRVDPEGQFEVAYDFPSPKRHGASPWAELLLGRDGAFYGSTGISGHSTDGTVFRFTPEGKLTTLHVFDRDRSEDGYNPIMGLVEAGDGEFIGSTYYGGSGNRGTLFRVQMEAAAPNPPMPFTAADGRPLRTSR